MKAEDFVLGSIVVGAVGALVYWVWRDVQKPPEEPTPDMIQQAFEEHLRRVEYEQNWLAEDGYC